MTLQTGQQIITIHILLNISRSKGNQIMKFGQIIECNVRNILFKNHIENDTGRIFTDLFLFFFKKSFILSKSKWSAP